MPDPSAPLPRLPPSGKIAFTAGNFGWSLAQYGVANLLTYFYLPNLEGGESMFPAYLVRGAVFLGMTLLGILASGGRLFDALSDPLIAGWSDRSRSRFGKRRAFMAASALPLGLFSWLVFLPPKTGIHGMNALWLVGTLLLFYLFFTMYMVPISAWVSELGHDARQRLDLSTLSSVGWALGFAAGNLAYWGQSAFESRGLPADQAFQNTIGLLAAVSVAALLSPVFGIDENRYAVPGRAREGSFAAMSAILKDRNVRIFLWSQLAYWIALTFMQVGISYFVVTLLGLDKSWASWSMTLLFIASFVYYVPINLAARRFGKKPVLTAAYVLLSLAYLFALFLGRYPVSGEVQVIVLSLAAALPIGIFTIIPFAVIADLAEADRIESESPKAGLFYAVRGLVMKFGIAVANLLFPTILILGTGDVNSRGVRLTAATALAASLVGTLIFHFGYDEQKVRRVLGD